MAFITLFPALEVPFRIFGRVVQLLYLEGIYRVIRLNSEIVMFGSIMLATQTKARQNISVYNTHPEGEGGLLSSTID
jgi:hypothetical protein